MGSGQFKARAPGRKARVGSLLLLQPARRRYSLVSGTRGQTARAIASDMGNSQGSTSSDASGMSLEALSEAFSAIEQPSASSVGGESLRRQAGNRGEDSPPAVSGETEEVTLGKILEAILFVGRPDNQSLESRSIAAIIGSISSEEVESLVVALNDQYAANGCPYTIASEGAGFRLVLRGEFSAVRDRYQRRIRAARLSPASIEVLAMVAYRGPLTADDVSRLRGTPSGHILRQLVQRQLLRIERPDEKPKKAVYHTTDRFLAVFGLESLGDLPKSEELAGR